MWFAKWAESANKEHTDMAVGVSGEGAGSLQGSLTMDTGSSGSEKDNYKHRKNWKYFSYWKL